MLLPPAVKTRLQLGLVLAKMIELAYEFPININFWQSEFSNCDIGTGDG